MMSEWSRLGTVPPGDLKEARLTTHYAGKLAGAIGECYLPPADDYGHISLSWIEPANALATQPVNADKRFRSALSIAGLEIMFIEDTDDSNSAILSRLALEGRTIGQAIEWIKSEAGKLGLDPDKLVIDMNKLPEHPLKNGQVFSRQTASGCFGALELYYANATRALTNVSKISGFGPVRCWPHHFDMDTVLKLHGAQYDDSAQVGAGFAPGDAYYAEPYFYVNMWPYPERWTPPDMEGGGFWRTEEWTGAVLTATHVTTLKTGADQQKAVNDFLLCAIETARGALAK